MKQATVLVALGFLILVSFVGGIFAERYFTGASLIGPILVCGIGAMVAAVLGHKWAIRAVILGYAVLPGVVNLAGNDKLTTVVRLAFYGAFLVVGIGNIPAGFRLLRNWCALSLLLYYIVAIASAGWSEDRVLTLGTAGGMMALLLFSLGAVARLGLDGTIRTLTWSLGAGVGLSVLLMIAAPHLAYWNNWASDQPRLKGITGHPVVFSEYLSCFLLCLFVEWRSRLISPRLAGSSALVAMICMVLTGTRSTLGLLVAAVLATMRGRAMACAVGAFVLFGGATVLFLSPSAVTEFGSSISRTGSVEGGLTLSGRVDLWKVAVSRFLERPWVGFGFYQHVIFNTQTALTEDSADTDAHAHNAILQSMVSLGIAGTIFLIPVFLAQLGHVLRCQASPLSPFIAFFLAISLVSLGGLETRPNVTAMVFMLTCVAGLAAADLEKRRAGSAQAAMGLPDGVQRRPRAARGRVDIAVAPRASS
jgi:O-antigen ligase